MRSTILRKLLSMVPSKSISFSARSAIIASTLAATGRAFAGSNPSGGVLLQRQVELTFDQRNILKQLVIEKLQNQALYAEQKETLNELIISLEQEPIEFMPVESSK